MHLPLLVVIHNRNSLNHEIITQIDLHRNSNPIVSVSSWRSPLSPSLCSHRLCCRPERRWVGMADSIESFHGRASSAIGLELSTTMPLLFISTVIKIRWIEHRQNKRDCYENSIQFIVNFQVSIRKKLYPKSDLRGSQMNRFKGGFRCIPHHFFIVVRWNLLHSLFSKI